MRNFIYLYTKLYRNKKKLKETKEIIFKRVGIKFARFYIGTI